MVGEAVLSAGAVCSRFCDLLLHSPRCCLLADAPVQHDSGKQPQDRTALQHGVTAMQHMGAEFGGQLLTHMAHEHAGSFWMDDLARAVSLACAHNEVDACRQLLMLGATRGDGLCCSDGWRPEGGTAAWVAEMAGATPLGLVVATNLLRACRTGNEAIARLLLDPAITGEAHRAKADALDSISLWVAAEGGHEAVLGPAGPYHH